MTSRTLSTALALAAALVTPAAVRAQSARRAPAQTTQPPPPTSNGQSSQGLRIDGLAGFEFVGGATGFKLRMDIEKEMAPLAPNMKLSVVLSLGLSHFGRSQSVYGYYDPFYGRYSGATTWDWSSNVFDLVPAVRFTIAAAPKLFFYGDAGLGLYYISTTWRYSNPLWAFEASDSAVGAVIRLAPGVYFDVNDRMRLGAELGLNIHAGDWTNDWTDNTTVTLLGALSYRM